MAKFFSARNNGVIALIREDDAKKFGEITRAGGDPFKVGVKVFTFTALDRLEATPAHRGIFTGTSVFMAKLIGGHQVLESSQQTELDDCWTGFVPYSNQDYDDPRYITTAQDVIEKFGLEL